MGLFMQNKNVWLEYVKLHLLKKSNTSFEYYYDSKLLTRAPFLLDRVAVTELEIEKEKNCGKKVFIILKNSRKVITLKCYNRRKTARTHTYTLTHDLLLRRHFSRI